MSKNVTFSARIFHPDSGTFFEIGPDSRANGLIAFSDGDQCFTFDPCQIDDVIFVLQKLRGSNFLIN